MTLEVVKVMEMIEIVKLIRQYPSKSNKKLSDLINGRRTPSYIKRIRYILNKATQETIEYIKANIHKSPAEIDKELNFQPGTTHRICKIYFDLTTLNPILDSIIQQIRNITGSR